ncbi:MAG: 50S ribosomal protein L7/L12, partial [Treponema sp.]|nr:50S ribosomal protein L7/L12 [Treponema sp.]
MMALTNDEILDAIANMTVQQAADLVKAMEEKFGVSAAAPVAVAAGPAAGPAAEEQTEFAVSLDSFDAAKKIAVIKVVKAALGVGLGDAK